MKLLIQIPLKNSMMKKIKRGEVVRAVHHLDDLDICTEIKKGDVENITLSMIED
jgi:hypothetical protein